MLIGAFLDRLLKETIFCINLFLNILLKHKSLIVWGVRLRRILIDKNNYELSKFFNALKNACSVKLLTDFCFVDKLCFSVDHFKPLKVCFLVLSYCLRKNVKLYGSVIQHFNSCFEVKTQVHRRSHGARPLQIKY